MSSDFNWFKIDKKYWSPIIIFLFAALHIAYINTPFVNLEWVYRFGSQFFITNEKSYLEAYFADQANPIIYSYLSSIIVTVTGADQFASYRIFALFGGTLVLIMLLKNRDYRVVIVVALNPLIWIYSGRAYAELLSVGLMMLAYNYQKKPIVGGLALGLSGIVKYHSLPFVLLNSGLRWIHLNWKNKFKSWNQSHCWFILVASLCFMIFISWYRFEFGFWLAPDRFRERHASISLANLLNNYFSYGFYLSGMFFLTIPAFLNTEKLKLKALLLVSSILLGFTNQNLGEMDFGSFQQLLGNEIVLLIKIIGFWNFLLCCQAFWKDEESRILLLTILGYILLLSLTRPANRYLIFVVPFWAILACQHISLSRMFWWGYISVLAGLNLFASLYQVSNATASANMADWAIQNDVRINLGGILHSHVGDFSHYDPNSPLIVSLAGAHFGRILHEEPVHVLGFQIRSYVLTDTNSN